MPQVVAHLDRGLAIWHRDVHVASADALLVGKHAETFADPAVPRGVGDGECNGHRRRRPGRDHPDAHLGGGRGDHRPQPGQLVEEVGHRVVGRGGGLDLTGREFQLEVDTAP